MGAEHLKSKGALARGGR